MDKKQQKKLDKQLKKSIIKQDLDGVKAVLGTGADPNKRIFKGTRPYVIAFRGTLSFWAAGALAAFPENTMIGLCLQKGTPEILKELLDAGGNPNVDIRISKSGSKSALNATIPIFHAIYTQKTDFIRVLLESNKIDPYASIVNHSILMNLKYQNLSEYVEKNGNEEIRKMVGDYIVRYKVKEEVEAIKYEQECLKNRKNTVNKKIKELGLNASDIEESKKTQQSKPQKIASKFSKTFKPGKK